MLENAQEYAQRRERLFAKIGVNGIAILATATEKLRNGDCYYSYRPNSDFYYLTGFMEPEAVAVFIPGRPEGQFILFNRPRDPVSEVWTGPRAGEQGACVVYGADQSFPIATLEQELPKLLENRTQLHYAIGRDMAFNRCVLSALAKVQAKVRTGVTAPTQFFNIETLVHDMRLRKSAVELAIMRQAADMSCQAHVEAMRTCRPGMREYDIEAAMQAVLTRSGSRAPAYNHIVGSGANSCVLHYDQNQAKINDGDLVLVDVGAEYQCYAADITRTFPANGRFSEAQRVIYELVLAAQLAVIELIKPGVSWGLLEQTADRVITAGLLKLQLLTGNLEQLLQQQAGKRFYMHRIGHWLGLDVHDVGAYKVSGEWRLLEPGMVFTVEPGIYIPAHSEGVDEKWWNIGVRIEDDVLVTEQNHEVLTAGVPKTIHDIEALMMTRETTTIKNKS